MKRRISILLTVALLISMMALLASCGHECTFSDEWSSDANNHWHACTDKSCTETKDSAAHTWDDGKITTAATPDADGVKTYTCTVCAGTKTEPVAFDAAAAWAGALTYDAFANYTMDIAMTASYAGVTMETTMLYKVTAEKVYMKTVMAGETMENIETEDIPEGIKEMADMFIEFLNYENFEYDAAAKIYKSKTTLECLFTGQPANNVAVKLADGKVSEIAYASTVNENGVDVTTNYVIVFSNYGTTVVTETVAE